MNPNPVLKKLGFSNTDRLVIFHTDDIGMCQASLAAFKDLYDFGLISSGAIMVPCPWFLEAAELCRSLKGVDMGVHTTLTCEWKTYRWGPLSTRDPASGLLDDEGCLWRTSKETQEHASADAVQVEIQAQVDKAMKAGIDITHIDTHMGTVLHQKFAAFYIQAAFSRRIPAMIPRLDAPAFERMGADPASAVMAAQMIASLEEQGFPLVDAAVGMPLEQPEDRVETAKMLLGELKPGVTHFILHPSTDTPELRTITPDWHGRVADYQAFLSEDLRRFVKDQGIQVIGYRHLRDLM